MATNPMQRKARSSFLLGMFITMIIASVIIVLLFLQIKKYKEVETTKKVTWVLKQNVSSGQTITADMLEMQEVESTIIPSDAVNEEYFRNYSLTDKEGNKVTTEYKDGSKGTLYITKDNKEYELKKENVGLSNGSENYYIEVNKEKQYIELVEVPIIAKINLSKNSIITTDMITKEDEQIGSDERTQEYNMILLPTQLNVGDYIDVRLTLPNGQDYIVVSKKKVENANEETIWLNMTEEETLVLSNAIIEHYIVTGSKLYATIYIEPGIQESLTPTYVPNNQVKDLLTLGKDTGDLTLKNDTYGNGQNGKYLNEREKISEIIKQYSDTSDANIEKGVSDEISRMQESREKYFTSLNGAIQ